MGEQQIELLQAELARVRAGALMDLQNLQADIVAKNRRIGQLEAELAKQAEDSPEAGDAKELLLLWRDEIKGGRKNVDIALDSDRGRAMLKSLKSKKRANGHDAKERIRRAILGCGYDDWAMGRTAKQDRPYNDVAKHILRDSDRFEHFEDLYAKHHPDDGVVKDAPVKPVVVKPDASVRPLPEYGRQPIYRVLDAIPGDVKPSTTQHCWMAQCPAHEDGRPSLSIRAVDRGEGEMVLLNCFAGCSTDAVVDALGLQMADLFASQLELTHDRPVRPDRVVPAHLRRTMKQLLDQPGSEAA